MRIGTTDIEMHPCGLTRTVFADGAHVDALPQDDDAYIARAEALGYGGDTLAMSREHELLHSLIAHWLGLPESPTLRGVATGNYWPNWHAEECAVLALQKYANAAGVDLMKLAR